MTAQSLAAVAQAMVAPGKGILAADESSGTIKKRFDSIKLESTAGTGHFYTTTKNKRTMPEKMEIKKFDPVARKHVIYKETKLK